MRKASIAASLVLGVCLLLTSIACESETGEAGTPAAGDSESQAPVASPEDSTPSSAVTPSPIAGSPLPSETGSALTPTVVPSSPETPATPSPSAPTTAPEDGGPVEVAPALADMIIDHRAVTSLFPSGHLDLSVIPERWIEAARQKLHIAYGHTSHGSQITTGMTGLMEWKGDLYAWDDEGGRDGALDLDDYAFSSDRHDLGHRGDLAWERLTRSYLDDPENSDVNVVMWSWCGGVSDNNAKGIDTYLEAMSQLEEDYPGVHFVYMTGHADGTGETGNLHLLNQRIREYCEANGKILYDFYDIECYDPDGRYYGDKNVTDSCDYDGGNWAVEWQNSHTEGVDWFNCRSAHSQPLNANQKAYAAWWLWARLAGWEGIQP